jgi:xenotropic and polytropic retrovirus receptor 1
LAVGKYFFSMLVIVTATLEQYFPSDAHRALWLAVACIATLYALAWDIKMDWGLLSWDPQCRLLRRRRMFRFTWFYYTCIAVNTVLRGAWVLTVSPETFHLDGMRKDLLLALVGALEVVRRGLWNIIRIEFEHVGNLEHFRSIEEVPLPYEEEIIAKNE